PRGQLPAAEGRRHGGGDRAGQLRRRAAARRRRGPGRLGPGPAVVRPGDIGRFRGPLTNESLACLSGNHDALARIPVRSLVLWVRESRRGNPVNEAEALNVCAWRETRCRAVRHPGNQHREEGTMATTTTNGRPARPTLATQIDRLDSLLDGLSENLTEAV